LPKYGEFGAKDTATKFSVAAFLPFNYTVKSEK
jgi:hypothetical protein